LGRDELEIVRIAEQQLIMAAAPLDPAKVVLERVGHSSVKVSIPFAKGKQPYSQAIWMFPTILVVGTVGGGVDVVGSSRAGAVVEVAAAGVDATACYSLDYRRTYGPLWHAKGLL
jgi:hypothetical protein